MEDLLSFAKKEEVSLKGLEQIIEGIGKYIDSTQERPICHKGETAVWYKGTPVPIELFEKLTNILTQKQNELNKFI